MVAVATVAPVAMRRLPTSRAHSIAPTCLVPAAETAPLILEELVAVSACVLQIHVEVLMFFFVNIILLLLYDIILFLWIFYLYD